MKDSPEIKAAQRLYRKKPAITAQNGKTIIEVKRHYDGAFIQVGMMTQSGGKILSISLDKDSVGGMSAEIGTPGHKVAIAAIVV